MRILILTAILLSSCQVTNPQALQYAIQNMQAERHHIDKMKTLNRVPMRPQIIQQAPRINPYRNPYQNPYSNPHNPMNWSNP